uniref:Uncharacterized protein n=1 Tax=Viltain virus TaxID=1955787 RepID=A0A1S5VG76_9VIRU|nr:putative protein 4 [Viltain virus]
MTTVQQWIPSLLNKLDETPLENGLTLEMFQRLLLKLELNLSKTLPEQPAHNLQPKEETRFLGTLKKCLAHWKKNYKDGIEISLSNLDKLTRVIPESMLLMSYSPEMMSAMTERLDNYLSMYLSENPDSSDTSTMETTSTLFTTAHTVSEPAAADSRKSYNNLESLRAMNDSFAHSQTLKQPTGGESSSIIFYQNGELNNFQIKAFPSDYILTLNLYKTENLYENGRKNFDENRLFGLSQFPVPNNQEVSEALEKLILLLKKDFMTRGPVEKPSMEKSQREYQSGTASGYKSQSYYKSGTQRHYKPYAQWKNSNNRRY